MDYYRWTLPLSAAAVIHGVAFFGFHHPQVRRHPGVTPPLLIADPIALVDELPETVPSTSDRPPSGGDPNPPPRGDDIPPPPRPDAVTVPVEPPAPPHPDRTISVIGPPSRFAGPGDGTFPGPWDGITPHDQLDQIPKTRLQPSPVYPYEARKDGRHGEVIVTFTVDEEGRVVNPVVLRSSDPAFETPTLRAVSRWRFEPGRKNGRIVRFRLAVPVQFALND